ncbi:MAG: hypothetical protein EAZ57_00225 [Cytophagales bacterium]|nr:MAG: hypothetical protein EAZ67_13040 [Cytophagales bacterium]TAF62497.1 MAG: hypothetical protein EAZ57_00225 [Cytophagales bacterium]
MYNFVFMFFYRYYERRKDIPRFSGAMLVGITLFFHVFFIHSVIYYFTGFNLTKTESYLYWGKTVYIVMLGAITGLPPLLYYSRKRTKMKYLRGIQLITRYFPSKTLYLSC